MPVGEYGEETGYWDSLASSRSNYTPTAQAAKNVSQLQANYPYLSAGVTFASANTGIDASNLADIELRSLLRGQGMPGEQVTSRRPKSEKLFRKGTRRLQRIQNGINAYLADPKKWDQIFKQRAEADEPLSKSDLSEYFDVQEAARLFSTGRLKNFHNDAWKPEYGYVYTLDAKTAKRAGNVIAGLTAPEQIITLEKRLRKQEKSPQEGGGGGLGDLIDFATLPLQGAGWTAGQAAAGIDKIGAATSIKVGGTEVSPLTFGLKGAALALNTGYQAMSAANRTLAPFTDYIGGNEPNVVDIPGQIAEQTDVYQAIRGKDLGEGILPSPTSEAGQAAVNAARRYSPTRFDGEAWTPGKSLANVVTTPGTTEFNVLSGGVDAAIALSNADPSSFILKRIAATRAAGETFITPTAEKLAEAGAVGGLSKATIGMRPTAWWEGLEGQIIVKAATEETSPANIWLAFNRKIGRDLANQIAATTDPGDMTRLLIERSGTDIANPLKKWAVNPRGRWASYTPTGYMDLVGDPDGAIIEAERYMQNAYVPFADRQATLDKLFRAQSGPTRYDAVDNMMEVVKTSLIRNGVDDPGRLDELTRIWKVDEQIGGTYWVDAITGRRGYNPIEVEIDGSIHEGSHPHVIAETLAKPVKLPDWRELRKAASPYSDLVDNKLWARTIGTGDVAMSVWRPAVLLRPAFMVRVVGDEQLRLAAEGLPNAFTHPIQLIGEMIGGGSKWASRLNRLTGNAITPSHATDVHGNQFDVTTNAQYAESQYAGGLHILSPKKKLSYFAKVNSDDIEFPRGMAEEVTRIGSSPEVAAALQMSPDDLMEWLVRGEGQAVRNMLVRMDGRLDDVAMLRRHVDSIYARIDDLSQGDPEILDMLRTQQVDGVPLWDAEAGRATPEAVAKFDAIRNEGRGPNWVKVSNRITEGAGKDNYARKAIDYLFDTILTKPSNLASRGPLYRAKYWERTEQIFPELSAKARKTILANLDETAGDAGVRLRNLDKSLRTAGLEGAGTIADAHLLANAAALDATKALLYDLSNKSQWSDAARLIAPFGESWREVMTTWARLVREQPQIIRRAEQAYIAARDAEIDPITGLPAAGGVGFFHPDPQTGQTVFTYPGSAFLTDKLLGVPIPLQGTVSGLNMIGQGMPGVGPAVSIPAAWFLPNKPSLDKVKEFIFPFGLPDEGSPLGDIGGELTAGWLKRINDAFSDPNSTQQYANATMDIAKYLASTGEYDLRGADPAGEVRRLLNDAREKAKGYYIIRGLAQATAPSAPGPAFLIRDKSGKLLLAATIAADYYTKTQEVGYDAAFEWLLDRYGVDNFLIPQAKSEKDTAGLSSTKAQYDFARNYDDIVERYPNTWALFAPQGDGFDYEAYRAEFQRGDREGLSPAEMVEKSNSHLANFLYFRAADQMGAKKTKAQEDYLRQLKADLRTQFPGYRPENISGGKLADQVAQLEEASLDPKMLQLPVGRALAEYMAERAWAIEDATKAGLTSGPWSAKKAQPLRDYLRELAQELIEDYPGFSRMWDSVLSREFKDGL